jgi:formylglycine-generating enzyme required for sulfatase activity
MQFSFHCPSCEGELEVDASLSGVQADCPQCGKLVAVPESRVDTGTTLAGFRLERRLGKGGMGEVFLARQVSVDREVAVKVLPPSFADNEHAVERFLHEGVLAAKLDHHHIVTVHEAGEDSGTYYLAMAYVEGESLDQRLKRDGALPEAEALGMVRDVAGALAYAWDEFQLLHRDIKPANIMLDRRGRVFLMDLGLAKSLGEDHGITLSGTILGTPQYMSPEQAQGISDLGPASDIYSLGATLYHLVTGGAPFTGDSVLEVLNQHIHKPLPPPRERNPNLSAACARLIETMMAKKPEERYGDWRALLADIDRILAHGSSAAPGQSLRNARPVVTQEALARQRQAQAARAVAAPSRRRLSPWVLGFGIAGALLLALAVAFALRGRSPGVNAESIPLPAGLPGQAAAPTSAAVPAEVPAPTAALSVPESVPAPAPEPAITPPAPAARTDVGQLGETATVDAEAGEPNGATKGADGAATAVPIMAGNAEKPALPSALAALAKLILAGRAAEACQAWGDNAPEIGQALTDAQRKVTTAELAALAGMDQQLLVSLQADIGKTVVLELVRQKVTCEVRAAAPGGIRVMQAIQQGVTTGKVGRTIRLAELSVAERLRRLGTAKTPELNLQRGLLALTSGRRDIARRLFARAAGPLGEALVAGLDERQAEARKQATERAVSTLLRRVSTSPRLGERKQAIADIRRRCGNDPLRVQSARKLLAEFEKEWGDSKAGKEWVAIVRDALNYPIDGDVPLVVPDLGMKLVPISPGTFRMGSDTGDVNEKPVHEVRITRGFWLGKYEVTQAQYEAIMGKNPAEFKGARNPVETVPWDDAAAFCSKLTARERAAGRLPAGYEYQLPTEAEWEYAARGGARSKGFTYSGSNNVNEVAWYTDGGDRSHPVGQRKPNELGLYDMSGNVWEWCHDWWGCYPAGTVTDPSGPAGHLRVLRGGGWLNAGEECRAANRIGHGPSYSISNIGFRVALAAPVQ